MVRYPQQQQEAGSRRRLRLPQVLPPVCIHCHAQALGQEQIVHRPNCPVAGSSYDEGRGCN